MALCFLNSPLSLYSPLSPLHPYVPSTPLCTLYNTPMFFVLHRAFFYFLCTVSGCDGGNRTRNIAVYTWRFSPLSYDRHPLSYDRHPVLYPLLALCPLYDPLPPLRPAVPASALCPSAAFYLL